MQLINRIYKDFVAPHEADLPATEMEGFQRVCSEKKRSHFSSEILLKTIADQLTCDHIIRHGEDESLQKAIQLQVHYLYKALDQNIGRL